MKKSSPSTSTSKRSRKVTAEKLLGYFDARRTAFLSALAAARQHYAVEGVHQLRVEVKRLRAFYKLIERTAPTFAAKPNAGSLRELYRAAGTLRDIDIFQAIAVERLDRLDLREYFNHLKSVEMEKRQKFNAVVGGFSESSLTGSRTKLRAALAASSDDQVRQRIHKRLLKLSAKLTKTLERKQQDHDGLHAVRKLSKTLRYTLDVWILCSGKSPAAGTAAIRLKQTYSALGEWHDHVVALESLKRYLKDRSSRKLTDPGAYATFRTILQKEIDKQITAFERGKQPLLRSLAGLTRSLERTAKVRSNITKQH
jgi:CHAD domain-containing protein